MYTGMYTGQQRLDQLPLLPSYSGMTEFHGTVGALLIGVLIATLYVSKLMRSINVVDCVAKLV
jgi:hypothetical protein